MARIKAAPSASKTILNIASQPRRWTKSKIQYPEGKEETSQLEKEVPILLLLYVNVNVILLYPQEKVYRIYQYYYYYLPFLKDFYYVSRL